MQKQKISGFFLILIGGLALLYSSILPRFGFHGYQLRLWPLLVTVVGISFVLPPFYYRQHRGLGALFIPGITILMTSALLMIGSLFNWWNVWAWLWPLVVIGLAVGFLAAAVYMRQVWLLLPAIIIGINGIMFQFYTLTGWWHLWAVLWPVEPLSVGLALLVVGTLIGSSKTSTAGVIVSMAAGFGFALMTIVLSGWASTIGAVVLILMGLGLLGQNMLRGGYTSLKANDVVEKTKEELYDSVA